VNESRMGTGGDNEPEGGGERAPERLCELDRGYVGADKGLDRGLDRGTWVGGAAVRVSSTVNATSAAAINRRSSSLHAPTVVKIVTWKCPVG